MFCYVSLSRKEFTHLTLNWTSQKSSPVFRDQRGVSSLACKFLWCHKLYFVITGISCRPHDRVTLKDMKADWHACLDSKVGFKVSC